MSDHHRILNATTRFDTSRPYDATLVIHKELGSNEVQQIVGALAFLGLTTNYLDIDNVVGEIPVAQTSGNLACCVLLLSQTCARPRPHRVPSAAVLIIPFGSKGLASSILQSLNTSQIVSKV